MRPTGEPLYLGISRILKAEIETSHRPGDRLESEGRLADRFGVNRHTLRRAIDDLVQQGFVERRRGLGVFVFGRPLDYALHAQTRITANLREMGVEGERNFFRQRKLAATPDIAEHLGLRVGRPVAVLDALVLADGLPFCLSSHCFPQSRFRQLLKDFEGGSLHAFIKERYGLTLTRTISRITALLPEPEDASLLRMALNQPVLRIRSINVDAATKEPVEYVISRFRADRVDFSVKF